MKNYFVCWAAQRQNGTVAAPVESFEVMDKKHKNMDILTAVS